MKNEQIRESSAIPAIIKAMEHDVSDAPTIDPVAAYKAVEEGVVGAYKAVEEGVVGAYKAVEKGAVDAYHKVEDAMVDKLFRKDGETVEQAKDRLRK
jgi:hypothetical protein